MNVTVAKSLIPRVTETFVSTPLRESDIVDEPTASEIETTESKDQNLSGNSSNDLEADSKETPSLFFSFRFVCFCLVFFVSF